MKKIITIDLGATHLRTALTNEEGKIITKQKENLNKGKISQQIIKLTEPIKGREVEAIAIGSIGPIDREKGAIVNPSNLELDFIPLVEPLQEEFNLPVKLFNDCQAATWGEKVYGAGKDVSNLIYVTVSTGIGGGAIVDDHLLKGATNNAAEIGHQTIEETYNFQCGCGERGHWEGMASGKNIPRFFKAWLERNNLKANFEPTDAKTILDKDNDTVKKFTEELGKYNARAVSNLIVAYNPELITFGGAVALNHPKTIIEPIKSNLDHFLEEPEIRVTPLGEEITLIGAAASYFRPPE